MQQEESDWQAHRKQTFSSNFHLHTRTRTHTHVNPSFLEWSSPLTMTTNTPRYFFSSFFFKGGKCRLLWNTISFIALQDGIHLSMTQQLFFFFEEWQRKRKHSSDCLGFLSNRRYCQLPAETQTCSAAFRRNTTRAPIYICFSSSFSTSSSFKYFISAAVAWMTHHSMDRL